MARHGGAVGVDIGSAAIKIVELAGDGEAEGNGTTVLAAASVPTPAGTIEEGRIMDVGAVGRALRELVQSAGVRSRRAVAAVNGQVALMREVRMPQLPAEEIRQAARFEVERYLPYPIAEVTFDTVVVGETRDGGASKVDVLVVAARTDVLRQHAAVLRAAGLEPVVLEVEPLAVVRAVSSRAKPEQVTACIHLGSSVTMILVAEGEVPRVIRTVAFGTAQLLEAASDHREAIDEGLTPLVTEIRRSLEYYGGRYRAVAPDRVVVTGGGAALQGVVASLTSALEVPVELADPFAHLGGPPRGVPADAGAAYAVAAGLARRGVDEP